MDIYCTMHAKRNFERISADLLVFVSTPIHNSIIISSKGTAMPLSYARYFHAVRWSEPGMENTPGCEWAAD